MIVLVAIMMISPSQHTTWFALFLASQDWLDVVAAPTIAAG